MSPADKTKQELIDELEALWERVTELERREKEFALALENLGGRTDRSLLPMSNIQEASFFVFDRKFEFVNDEFVELFGVSPEEACSSHFSPMTLIAPESHRLIREQYKEGCRGEVATKQLKFTALTKDGLKIECEAFLLFIPYKWGVGIHGTLHSVSVNRRTDETLPQRHSDLRRVFNAVPAGVLYAERDRRLM